MKKRPRWHTPAVVLSAIVCVGWPSFAADYSPVTALLEPQSGAVGEIIQLLNKGEREAAGDRLDSLCSAVIRARAALVGTYFTGSADNVSDPFALPAGASRVHLKTDGAPFVAAIPLASPEWPEHIFMLMSNDAVDGISAFYVSDGERIVLEFAYVDAPYEVWFEKID